MQLTPLGTGTGTVHVRTALPGGLTSSVPPFDLQPLLQQPALLVLRPDWAAPCLGREESLPLSDLGLQQSVQ